MRSQTIAYSLELSEPLELKQKPNPLNNRREMRRAPLPANDASNRLGERSALDQRRFKINIDSEAQFKYHSRGGFGASFPAKDSQQPHKREVPYHSSPQPPAAGLCSCMCVCERHIIHHKESFLTVYSKNTERKNQP